MAQIMEERTGQEKEMFGKVKLQEVVQNGKDEPDDDVEDIMNDKATGGFTGHAFNEEQIDKILETYLEELKDPKELLHQCIQRSRDRFQREYAKLKAFRQQQKFYTDEGVKERAQSLRFKFLLKERHPECKTDADVKSLPADEKVLSMLVLHNTKVKKIMDGYRNEYEKKKRAKDMGITLKELDAQEGTVLEVPVAKKKKAGKTSRSRSKHREAKNKKANNANNNDFECVIKVKGQDGEIQDFDRNAPDSSAPEQQQPAGYRPGPIEAEDTLEMLQSALGGTFNDKEAVAKKPPIKKPAAKKKAPAKKKKEEVDRVQKFFNDYGENPHLQQIENGYLKFLEAQHAKESHLKAIKKFQILYALKQIQRYWKIKFKEIQGRSAKKIQRAAHRFIKKMDSYREKLEVIRKRLLMIRLNQALRLYIRKRRAAKVPVRPDAIQIAGRFLDKVAKIQNFIRRHVIGKNILRRQKQHNLAGHRVLQQIYLRKYENRLTRDKETYWV